MQLFFFFKELLILIKQLIYYVEDFDCFSSNKFNINSDLDS